MKFACPHCQQVLEADDSYAGTTVDCPACGQPFAVGAETPAAATPPAPRPETPSPAKPKRKAKWPWILAVAALVAAAAGGGVWWLSRGASETISEKTTASGNRDEPVGADAYRRAAERGDAEAQCRLGKCCGDGTGVAKSDEEAAKWFQKAAERGNAGSQYMLGMCYKEGGGMMPQNDEEAAKWFLKAAEQGHAEAQYEIALCYMNGVGVPSNALAGLKWLGAAANQGHAKAQYGTGVATLSIGQTELAAQWFRKAADQGIAEAAEELKKLELAGAPGGRTMTLREYSPVIDENLKRNILLSESGQYLGAVLAIVAHGRGGEELAKELGTALSGRDIEEMDEILARRGCGDAARVVESMTARQIQEMAVKGYPYINRLKFWRAATLEALEYSNFMEVTEIFTSGRTPGKANLSQAEMAEILGALGIVRGVRLDEAEKEFASFASHFNLGNGKDREAFAEALVFGCHVIQDRNLALQRGMTADEVFQRIKDVAAILAAEAGTPEAAVARPAAAKPAPAEAMGNTSQTASQGGAGAGAPSLSAALEAAKKTPTQENFKRAETLWEGLPEERKTALQASVMGAFCAMLMEEGDTSEMAKRMKYVDFQALRRAVSEPCQTCGGSGRVQEKCPECGGSGKCSGCHGSGTAVGGLYGKKIPCPKCRSTGRCSGCSGGEREVKCRMCTGSGKVQSKEKCRKVIEEQLEEALRICRKKGL